MKAVLLRVAKGRVGWADTAVAHYAKRLQRMKLVEERIPTARFRGDVEAVRAEEAQLILSRLRPRDRLIALDERGELPSTETLAQWVDRSAHAGVGRLVFAIGGPYGHGAAVREAAWRSLALSKMVTNHELARVFMVEQLYRVSTVLWGGAYHH